MRSRVYRELIDYLKLKFSDVSIRIIEVMNILLALEKATNTIKNCGHIARVFDLKGKKCPIYEVMDC
uniref:Transcriptional regulator n=1 Tax=Caenorhabditis tropicalis TaxID=1561998 RepID=A0A1I7T6Q8_9PELO